MCIFKRKTEPPSPNGIINISDIIYYETTESLEIRNLKSPVWITTVANTNSMLPIIDAGDIAILSKDFKHENLIVGDVVVYEALEKSILHRIIQIAETAEGDRLYTCRGDNCDWPDPYVLSDEHIKWYFVGVLYCKKGGSDA